MAAEAAVIVDRVSHGYGAGELRREVLRQVSLVVEAGEIVLVTGPSGSGKTTLLTLIGGLRATQSGRLRVLGHELFHARRATLTAVRRQIGFVFQHHNLLDALTVTDNVLAGLRQPDVAPAAARARARDVLASVGLGERATARPAELSGGQKQRIAIARAVVGRPRLLLADEPTASLDRQAGREVVELLRLLARTDGCAVMLVTHDSRIFDVADRIVHIEDGCISSRADAVHSTDRALS